MRRADHAWLEAQRVSDVLVDARRRVVPHDEVVAVGVLHLVDGDGLGQREDAPVGEAADDAAVFQDEGADGLGDSFLCLFVREGESAAIGSRGDNILFDLDEVARPDLRGGKKTVSAINETAWSRMEVDFLTMAMSS